MEEGSMYASVVALAWALVDASMVALVAAQVGWFPRFALGFVERASEDNCEGARANVGEKY
ncbi:hypothetical protein E4U25_000274, partial [Claviceps purpurea]